MKRVKQYCWLCLCFMVCLSCRKKTNTPAEPETVACFQLTKNFQKPYEAIQFTNCSENFDAVVWDFDDGSTSNEANPKHVWNKVGAYKVSLKVSKNNKTASFTKKIVIANSVQIDFTATMKNFKGLALTNTFSCNYSAFNSLNQETVFFNLSYPAITNANYSLRADMSGLYVIKEADRWHRFKVLAKTNQGPMDSLVTDLLDVVESDNFIQKTKGLNFCDIDYSISILYQ